MDRWGNGAAPGGDVAGSSGDAHASDETLSESLSAAEAQAAQMTELSRRALAAQVDLLAYVDELEAEVRRLRRLTPRTAATDADATGGG